MIGNKTCSMKGKGCYQFYYSDDYGMTNHVKALPDTFFAKCWPSNPSAILKRIGEKVVFVTNTYNKPTSEIWLSTNLGDTWKGILKDSVITAAEVKGNILYAATNKGTIIKLDTDQLITANKAFFPSKIEAIYYAEGFLVNPSPVGQTIHVFDLQGRLCSELSVGALQSHHLSLPSGVYAVTSLSTNQRIKILVP